MWIVMELSSNGYYGMIVTVKRAPMILDFLSEKQKTGVLQELHAFPICGFKMTLKAQRRAVTIKTIVLDAQTSRHQAGKSIQTLQTA
jgi:hypothetical protein